MLRISLEKPKPFTLEAPDLGEGVRFHVKPITVPMVLAARNAAAIAMNGMGSDLAVAYGDGVAAFTRIIVGAGLTSWDGVMDWDGQPLPVTPENIDALLSNVQCNDWLYRSYVMPVLENRRADAGTEKPAP